MAKRESADGDMVDAGAAGMEHRLAGIDLHRIAVGIRPGQAGQKAGVRGHHPGKPPGRAVAGVAQFEFIRGLRKPAPLEIDGGRLMGPGGVLGPLSPQHIGEGVEIPENGMRYVAEPQIVPLGNPSADFFGAAENHPADVVPRFDGDGQVIGKSSAGRIDPFPVHTGGDANDIPGPGAHEGGLHMAERIGGSSGGRVIPVGRYVDDIHGA